MRRLGVALIVAGFVALVAAAWVLGGVGAALVVVGAELVVGGYVVVFVDFLEVRRREPPGTVRP